MAIGAWVLNSSVIAKMPSNRMPVSTTSSQKAWTGVMCAPGAVKNTPAAPPAARVSPWAALYASITGPNNWYTSAAPIIAPATCAPT